MNTSQIRYFVTVAQLQNISKAAENLHISQPALSKSIASLEEELGTPLFSREGKRISLNPAGKLFLENAWGILRNLDNAILEINQLKSNIVPTITVGLCEPDEKISAYISEFAISHTEIEFNIRCNIDMEENPDINQYDMIVCPDNSKFSKLKGTALNECIYLAAIPSGHRLASKSFISAKDMEGEAFVFINHENRYIEEPYYICLSLNIPMKARYFTNNPFQHLQFISSGAAAGFVSESCSSIYRNDPGIRLIPISGNKFKHSLMMCFKRDKHLSPIAKEFKSFMYEKYSLSES